MLSHLSIIDVSLFFHLYVIDIGVYISLRMSLRISLLCTISLIYHWDIIGISLQSHWDVTEISLLFAPNIIAICQWYQWYIIYIEMIISLSSSTLGLSCSSIALTNRMPIFSKQNLISLFDVLYSAGTVLVLCW